MQGCAILNILVVMKMKRLLIAMLSVMLCACSSASAGNGCENLVQESGERANMSGYEMLEDDEHVFYQKTMEEVLALFEEGKSAIVYLGYVGCPWCEEAVPIMNEVAKAKGLTICYAPTYDDGEYTITDEIEEQLYSYLDAFLEEDDEGEKRMYVPYVFVIRDGKVISAHEGTVESHDAHERQMTDSEKIELTNTYQDMFAEIAC